MEFVSNISPLKLNPIAGELINYDGF